MRPTLGHLVQREDGFSSIARNKNAGIFRIFWQKIRLAGRIFKTKSGECAERIPQPISIVQVADAAVFFVFYSKIAFCSCRFQKISQKDPRTLTSWGYSTPHILPPPLVWGLCPKEAFFHQSTPPYSSQLGWTRIFSYRPTILWIDFTRWIDGREAFLKLSIQHLMNEPLQKTIHSDR